MSDYTEGFEDGFRAAIGLLRGFPKDRVLSEFSGDSRISNTAAFAEMERGRSTRRRAGKRKASPWNDFVAAEMPKVLKKHPRFTPQRAMKEVSRRWKTSPKNPNRRKKR